VDFEVVPGVTAATAAAARTGISLTSRGHASMLVLATGSDHTGRGVAALDWALLAHAEATLVFYMPVQGLEAITSALTTMGRDARERALVIERAGTLDERVVAGRLGDIAGRCREVGVGAPAVLLVGPTLDAASLPVAVRHLTAAQA
jgi:siroheme synthase